MEARRALDLSVQEVIYAGLEALQAVTPLDVCAYLNRSDSTGTQLFLGAPPLETSGGQRAYDIFSALQNALDRPRHRSASASANGTAGEVIDIGGTSTVVVVTIGAVSHGAHAFGRNRPLGSRERAALLRLSTALATAVHRLQAATESPGSAP